MAEEIEGVKLPTLTTLAGYGLTLDDWLVILVRQGYRCGVCKKKPKSGRLFTDHEHVRGWKRLPPAERALYVRGLACYVCNRFVLNYRINAKLLRQAATYLDAYDGRRSRGL